MTLELEIKPWRIALLKYHFSAAPANKNKKIWVFTGGFKKKKTSVFLCLLASYLCLGLSYYLMKAIVYEE